MEQKNLFEQLSSNPYPGRGIVLGRTADDKHAVIAYFIMGRSENSRNRIFSVTGDGIRTEAYDPSKMDRSVSDYLRTRSASMRARPLSPMAIRPIPSGILWRKGSATAMR